MSIDDISTYKNIAYNAFSVDGGYMNLFKDNNLKTMQDQITKYLHGVADRPILVPISTIVQVLSTIVRNDPPTKIGDIYTKDTIVINRDDAQKYINSVINIIVSQIRDEYEQIENNRKLSVWNTLRSEGNDCGLRSHSTIKIRKRRPQTMFFWENY